MLENLLHSGQSESKVDLNGASKFPSVSNTIPSKNSESFKSVMSSSISAEIINQHNQVDTGNIESNLLSDGKVLKNGSHSELNSISNAENMQLQTNTTDELNDTKNSVQKYNDNNDEFLVGEKMPIDGNLLPENKEQYKLGVVNSQSDVSQLVTVSNIKNNDEAKNGTATAVDNAKLANAKLTTDILPANSKLNDVKFVDIKSGKQEPTILKELLQNNTSLEKVITDKALIDKAITDKTITDKTITDIAPIDKAIGDKIASALNSGFKNNPIIDNNLSLLDPVKAVSGEKTSEKSPENSSGSNANAILSSSVSATKLDLVGDNGKPVPLKEAADLPLKSEVNLANHLTNTAPASAVKHLSKEEMLDKINSVPTDKKDLEKPAINMSRFFGNKETNDLKSDNKTELSKADIKTSESTLDKSNPLTKNLFQTKQSEYSAISNEFKVDELKSVDGNMLNKSTTLSQQFLQYAKLSNKDDLLARATLNSVDTPTNSSASLSNPTPIEMVNSQLQVTNTHQISAKAAEITLPVSLPTHQWNKKFAEHVSMLAIKGASHAQIKLDPPELGPLAVRIHHSGADTQIQFQVQNPVARDLVDSAMHRLREMLEEQGFENVNVDINERDQNEKENFDNVEHGHDSENSLDESEQSKVAVEDTSSNSLVDIFA